MNNFLYSKGSTYIDYAEIIYQYLSDKNKIKEKKDISWETIKHLTLDKMVNNFITSIESLRFE